MANPIEPTKTPSIPEEAKIQPTGNDPTPEERKGDSRFLPVIILAGIALVVLLIAAVFLIKGKGTKVVPHEPDSHPTSSVTISVPPLA
jgi:flagellar basal body-associated protein FliL